MTNVELVKRAALGAVAASNPTAILFGTVASVTPLKVRIDQKMILDESFLILTSAVMDHDVQMTMDHSTGATSGGSGEASFASHSHTYSGTKNFTIKNGLTLGEGVLLLRVQGGQKFVVIDRVVIPT